MAYPAVHGLGEDLALFSPPISAVTPPYVDSIFLCSSPVAGVSHGTELLGREGQFAPGSSSMMPTVKWAAPLQFSRDWQSVNDRGRGECKGCGGTTYRRRGVFFVRFLEDPAGWRCFVLCVMCDAFCISMVHLLHCNSLEVLQYGGMGATCDDTH